MFENKSRSAHLEQVYKICIEEWKLWNLIFDIFQPLVLGAITPATPEKVPETSAGGFPFDTPIIAISLASTSSRVKLHL